MKIKCNKCGYIGEEDEFPKGRDFFQKSYVRACAKECGNVQSPSDASMRMMPDKTHPFEYVREPSPDDSLSEVMHNASEAS